jgi:hypothetical protein
MVREGLNDGFLPPKLPGLETDNASFIIFIFLLVASCVMEQSEEKMRGNKCKD